MPIFLHILAFVRPNMFQYWTIFEEHVLTQTGESRCSLGWITYWKYTGNFAMERQPLDKKHVCWTWDWLCYVMSASRELCMYSYTLLHYKTYRAKHLLTGCTRGAVLLPGPFTMRYKWLLSSVICARLHSAGFSGVSYNMSNVFIATAIMWLLQAHFCHQRCREVLYNG